MANPYVNHVKLGSELLIDLRSDTITADRLCKGYTAHGADGGPIVGTLEAVPLTPIHYDWNIGYIQQGTWVYENPTNTYIDIYEAKAGHRYFITLGGTKGSRFRSMFTTTDVTTVTSGSVVGTQINNINNPSAYANTSFTATDDGYILIGKDNVGVSGLKTYVYDATAGWL